MNLCNRCIAILINWCDINKVTISYICHLHKAVVRKKNFRYVLFAQYLYVTCAFKSNLNINPEPQLLSCTPVFGYKFQPTYTPHLQYLQLVAHLESSQTFAIKLGRWINQRVSAKEGLHRGCLTGCWWWF